MRFDHPVARNLVDMLPPMVRVQAGGSPQADRMQGTLSLMAAEARELRPGGEAVITRLADILVIQAVRSWIETDPAARTGWLGALQDPQIGHAITLIHADPARAWSVAALADELAMSRSAFAARFTELMGEPVMQYVTRWRMHVAADELAQGGDRGPAGRAAGLRLRGGVRARVQARDRDPARRGAAPGRGVAHPTRSSRGLGRCSRPTLATDLPSSSTTSAVKSFWPRSSDEPTP